MVVGEATRLWRNRLRAQLNLEHSLLYHLWQVFLTLNLVLIGWVFFRADSLHSAWYIVSHMYIPARITFADMSYGVGLEQFQTCVAWALIVLMIVMDYVLLYKPITIISLWRYTPLRWATYTVGAYSLVFFGVWGQIQFIYFQF